MDEYKEALAKAQALLTANGYKGEPTPDALEAAGFDASKYLSNSLNIQVRAAITPEGKELQAALAAATAEAKENAKGGDILGKIAGIAKIAMKFIPMALFVVLLVCASGCSATPPQWLRNNPQTKAEPVDPVSAPPAPLDGYKSIPGRPDKGPPDKEARAGATLTDDDRELLKKLIAKL